MAPTKRQRRTRSSSDQLIATQMSESELTVIEEANPKGLTAQQIVSIVSERGSKLTEATFRKYVQLGLLPRSVRVGRKGKNKGSQGLYPATAIRQIVNIRSLMAEGFTIEEIQSEFLFVRGDIDALTRQINRVFDLFERAIDDRRGRVGVGETTARELEEARATGRLLMSQLIGVERRITQSARMERAAV